MIAKLVDNLIHLESCCDALNQDSSSDGTTSHSDVVLCKVEHIVPESGLEMALHLGQVKVWTSPPLDQLVCIVEEVKTKVEERTRDGLAVNCEVLLLEVPATSTGDKSW